MHWEWTHEGVGRHPRQDGGGHAMHMLHNARVRVHSGMCYVPDSKVVPMNFAIWG